MKQVAYHEPPLAPFQDLPGVTGTARVQERKNISLLLGSRNLGKVTLLGINPQEFGRTARFISELTPVSPARYLNALAADERAVLLSAGLAQRLGLKTVDQLTAKSGSGQSSLSVAGIVSYWPGLLPADGDFAIDNLAYLQDSLGLAPYNIWLRLAPDASTAAVVTALASNRAALTGLEDGRAAVAGGRREPFRLGVYGTLSAGFIVALAVMALTYLMGVGLSLQRRAKELGVLRAMGMPGRQVALSLYLEQVILILSALAAGLPAGAGAAAVYVPILRLEQGTDPLPLQVTTVQADRVFVLSAAALALLMGIAIVAAWLRAAVNRELKTTIVYVTHDMEIAGYAMRAVRIRDGKVATESLRGEGQVVVVDTAGRLQVPRQILAAGIDRRAEVILRDREVIVRSPR